MSEFVNIGTALIQIGEIRRICPIEDSKAKDINILYVDGTKETLCLKSKEQRDEIIDKTNKQILKWSRNQVQTKTKDCSLGSNAKTV